MSNSPSSVPPINKPTVALFGSFLSSKGFNKVHGEQLAEKLREHNWSICTASDKVNRLARLLHMISIAWGQRQKYDVAAVEVYSGKAFLWAEAVCLVLRLLGKPYLLILHGGNLPVFARKWPGRVERLLRSATKVVTPSEYLRNHLGQIGNNLKIIPNPIDLDRYHMKRREKVRPRMVWLRAFAAIYNPCLAAQVVAILKKRWHTIRLDMAGPDKGDGSYRQTVTLVDTLQVTSHVSFPGAIAKEAVPEYLSEHDIFINTTNIDNQPVSLIEAMACGLCIVSTNVGGIPDLLVDEKEALLVPPDMPEAMADAVHRILVNPDLAAKLSANAREKAEHFNWKDILPQWEKIFFELGCNQG